MIAFATLALSAGLMHAQEKAITSGEYFVTQSWSQETEFRRPYFVNVPTRTGKDKLPVFIFLHGNGGNAKGAMRGFLQRNRRIASKYVTVFANGYAESWNIVSERSKADDRQFIEEIVKTVAAHSNVQSHNFTIMGSSNGAALVNQLAIESKLPNICNYISAVSPLNVFQYDGKHFKVRGEKNEYDVVGKPMTGKRLMNISGTRDKLVPYLGGKSRVIPAKGGKLGFVDAEQSTFLWAKHMGHKGKKLPKPTRAVGKLEIFSYLDGDVIHYKVNGEGHGASRAVTETMLLDFIEGGDKSQR